MVNDSSAYDLPGLPAPSRNRPSIFETERELESSLPRLPLSLLAKLEGELCNLHMELQPRPSDYHARRMAVDFVNSLAREKISSYGFLSICNGFQFSRPGGYHARPLGSYVMDMFTRDSDLDISVSLNYGNRNHKREERIQVLKKLTRSIFALRDGGIVRDVVPVFKAKVPVLKFTHCKTGIECDVSVQNNDGVVKSELLKVFSSIDPRFRTLCFLMKYWANVNMINSSKHQTLNSLSITLLVAVHLQTRVPAILPPFSALLQGMEAPFSLDVIRFAQNQAQKYQNFGKRNKETIAELFRSFIIQMMAAKNMWRNGLRASSYLGVWTMGDPDGLMFVEDFSQPSQNAARAVNMAGFESIYSCIEEAFVQIKDYALGVQGVYSLREALFSNCLTNQKRRSLQYTLPNASDNVLPSPHRFLTDFIPGDERGKHIAEAHHTQKRIRLIETGVGDDNAATKHGMYQNMFHQQNNPIYHTRLGQPDIGRFPPALAGIQPKPFEYVPMSIGIQAHHVGSLPYPPLNALEQRLNESYVDKRIHEHSFFPVRQENMLENSRKRFHPNPEPIPLYQRPYSPTDLRL